MLEKRNQQALAKIDEAIESGNKNVAQGEFGLMLAESKENGVKQGIDMLAQNFAKIEQNMDAIQSMELEKPHPDTKFNQDSQLKKNLETANNIQSRMDDIRRLYINLKKEDEEFDELQAKVDGMKKSVGQNKANLSQISKQIVQKNNANKQVGAVSDEEWNKQFGFVLEN